jgi:DNA-binding NarL/FixJ family response regulator
VLPRNRVTGEQVVATIETIRRQQHRVPADLLGQLLAQVERVQRDVLRPKGLAEPLLAPRERDVLRLLAEGLDTAAIAERLSYSERTVKNIVQAVLSRLSLRNRAHAVAYAMRVGVI